MKVKRNILAILIALVVTLVYTSAFPLQVDAANKLNKTKKTSISATKVSITVGKSKTITMKNIKSKVKWSTSNKKVASIKTSGKNNYKCKIIAKKSGSTTIKAKVGKKIYKCKIIVKKQNTKHNSSEDNPSNNNESDSTSAVTPNPNSTSHTHNYVTTKTEATCEKEGSEVFKCECGNTITKTLPATGHDVSDYIITSQPTCSQKGCKQKICKTCNKVIDSQYIDKTQHIFDEGTVTEESTEDKTGIMTYTCTVCGYTKQQSIPVKDTVSENNIPNIYLQKVYEYTDFEISEYEDENKTYRANISYVSLVGDTYTDKIYTLSTRFKNPLSVIYENIPIQDGDQSIDITHTDKFFIYNRPIDWVTDAKKSNISILAAPLDSDEFIDALQNDIVKTISDSSNTTYIFKEGYKYKINVKDAVNNQRNIIYKTKVDGVSGKAYFYSGDYKYNFIIANDTTKYQYSLPDELTSEYDEENNIIKIECPNINDAQRQVSSIGKINFLSDDINVAETPLLEFPTINDILTNTSYNGSLKKYDFRVSGDINNIVTKSIKPFSLVYHINQDNNIKAIDHKYVLSDIINTDEETGEMHTTTLTDYLKQIKTSDNYYLSYACIDKYGYIHYATYKLIIE